MRLTVRRRDITCRRAVDLIGDYLEGALPRRRRASLERHLVGCRHCAEYLAQLRATIAATGRIDSDELSPEVQASLIELYRATRGRSA